MAKDWLNQYKGGVRKFQEGGAMTPAPAQGGAPGGQEGAPQGGGADIEAMLSEYAQTRDPQLAVAICDMLVEAMMGAQQGGQPGAPAPGAEAGAPQGGAPMGRNGMRMTRGPVFRK